MVRFMFVMAAAAIFGGLGYFFYKELFAEKEDPIRAKRERLEAKRAAKKDK